jgi:hypothetical protein
MKYLTPTLLNQFNYYLKADNEEEALNQLISMLSKTPTPPKDAMKAGIDFESKIHNAIKNKDNTNLNTIEKKLFDKYQDAVYQYPCQKEIDPFGDKIMLYGKIDFLLPFSIADLKTTSNYEVGKYYDSLQHKIYMYATGNKVFDYDVVKLDEEGNATFYTTETYNYDEEETQLAIFTACQNFLTFTKNNKEVGKLFNEKWEWKGKEGSK